MKRKCGTFFGFAVLLMTAILIFTGCDTGTGGSSFIPVTGITNVPQIALTNIEMELNGVVLPSNATNQTIKWSGASVANGKFTAATVGSHSVTAIITNGASESSPYTKTFTIVAYAGDDTSKQVAAAQGSWTMPNTVAGMSGTDTFVITGYSWELKNSEMGDATYCKGIVLNADGTNYLAQVTAVMDNSYGYLVPRYLFDYGTYNLEGNKITFTSQSDLVDDPMTGTWKKVE